MTDERYVLNILQTHHADQLAVLLERPEPDPMRDLVAQLLARISITSTSWGACFNADSSAA